MKGKYVMMIGTSIMLLSSPGYCQEENCTDIEQRIEIIAGEEFKLRREYNQEMYKLKAYMNEIKYNNEEKKKKYCDMLIDYLKICAGMLGKEDEKKLEKKEELYGKLEKMAKKDFNMQIYLEKADRICDLINTMFDLNEKVNEKITLYEEKCK